MWESYFDRESGWYCIGNPILENGDTAVIIIDNMIAVVDNTSELKAVWAQPMFIQPAEQNKKTVSVVFLWH